MSTPALLFSAAVLLFIVATVTFVIRGRRALQLREYFARSPSPPASSSRDYVGHNLTVAGVLSAGPWGTAIDTGVTWIVLDGPFEQFAGMHEPRVGERVRARGLLERAPERSSSAGVYRTTTTAEQYVLRSMQTSKVGSTAIVMAKETSFRLVVEYTLISLGYAFCAAAALVATYRSHAQEPRSPRPPMVHVADAIRALSPRSTGKVVPVSADFVDLYRVVPEGFTACRPDAAPNIEKVAAERRARSWIESTIRPPRAKFHAARLIAGSIVSEHVGREWPRSIRLTLPHSVVTIGVGPEDFSTTRVDIHGLKLAETSANADRAKEADTNNSFESTSHLFLHAALVSGLLPSESLVGMSGGRLEYVPEVDEVDTVRAFVVSESFEKVAAAIEEKGAIAIEDFACSLTEDGSGRQRDAFRIERAEREGGARWQKLTAMAKNEGCTPRATVAVETYVRPIDDGALVVTCGDVESYCASIFARIRVSTQ